MTATGVIVILIIKMLCVTASGVGGGAWYKKRGRQIAAGCSGREVYMGKLIEFGRMFLSYGLLMLIIAAVGAVAIFIGITMAKKKKAKNTAAAVSEEEREA